MDTIQLTIALLCAGLICGLLSYFILQRLGSRVSQKEIVQSQGPEKLEYFEYESKNTQFGIWQSLKFGFGFGIGFAIANILLFSLFFSMISAFIVQALSNIRLF